MRSSMWLFALVLFAGLGIGGDAHAGGKMDWSDYLEPPGARAPRQATPTQQRPAQAEKSSKKVSRAEAKKAAKAKAKKAKRSARNKRRR